jgi:hypothetical protein
VAKCSACGSTIVLGGVKDGGLLFCNTRCRDNSHLVAASAQLPDEFVVERAREIHSGPCPKCGGEGPVDVHISHNVFSMLIMTTRSSKPQICCQSCGRKAKIGALLSSAVFGWWGFPWGFIWTPIQITRNLNGLFSGPDPSRPSDDLVGMTRGRLSAQLVKEDRAKAPERTLP